MDIVGCVLHHPGQYFVEVTVYGGRWVRGRGRGDLHLSSQPFMEVKSIYWGGCEGGKEGEVGATYIFPAALHGVNSV